jgi:TPR repeat protein
MIKLLRTTAFLLCTAVAAPAMAGNLDDILEAYQAGDYETALQEFHPLAEQGNAEAQYNLGSMYAYGEGVVRDAVIAHMWLTISSANGDTDGSRANSVIEQDMTLEQIAEAQELARRCMASEYQDCG